MLQDAPLKCGVPVEIATPCTSNRVQSETVITVWRFRVRWCFRKAVCLITSSRLQYRMATGCATKVKPHCVHTASPTSGELDNVVNVCLFGCGSGVAQGPDMQHKHIIMCLCLLVLGRGLVLASDIVLSMVWALCNNSQGKQATKP